MSRSRPVATRTFVAAGSDRSEIGDLVGSLQARSDAPESVTLTIDGVEHQMPPMLVEALTHVGLVIAHGRPVTVSEQEHLLTPHEAADLLGITRLELDRRWERGELPFQAVGRHHRIALADLSGLRRDVAEGR